MKQIKNNFDVVSEIQKVTNSTTKGLKKLRGLAKKEQNRVKQFREFERFKWNEFKKIVKGQEYFRFAHLDALNIERDYTIFLSAKNAGKTTEIYRVIADCIAKGKKFIYGRIYPQEMHSAVFQFESDKNSPVIILTRLNRWYFYKKTDVDIWRSTVYAKEKVQDIDGEELPTYPTITHFQKLGIKPCGLGFTLYNSNLLGGMNYDNYTHIIFDEFLSYSPINRVNNKVLHAWTAAVSTITRKKKDIKIYAVGNLLNVPNHPILKFYDISIDDDLRIIKRGENNDCTILFINGADLYKSTFKNQAGITKHGSIESNAFLSSNKVLKPNTNILTPQIFENLKHDLAFAVMLHDGAYFVELKTLELEDNKIFGIRCDMLKTTTVLNGDVYAQDPIIFNKFENVTPAPTIQHVFNYIFNIYRIKELKFESIAAFDNYKNVLESHQSLLYEYE